MEGSRKIFDRFLIVLSSSSAIEKPSVIYHYPRKNANSTGNEGSENLLAAGKPKDKDEEEEDLATVPQFCFPESDQIYNGSNNNNNEAEER